MLKTLVVAGAYASGNVPMTVNQATNDKYVLDADNAISIRTVGLTEIKANITVEALAADELTLTLYADGVAVPGATDTKTIATIGDRWTFHIDDIVRTAYRINPEFSKIALQFSDATTLVGGDLILAYEH